LHIGSRPQPGLDTPACFEAVETSFNIPLILH
jgi:hypothetical protein